MLWILEMGIYGDGHPLMKPALKAGHNVFPHGQVGRIYPDFKGPVVFHGSMTEAQVIIKHPSRKYVPGVFCDAEGLSHSAIDAQLGEMMLNHGAIRTTVREMVHHPVLVASTLGAERAFVRPDSPLKQFSGRVVDLDASLLLEDLDHGFYYDDIDLPIIAAREAKLEKEWRFVIVGGRVITMSGYNAAKRKKAVHDDAPWGFAERIAGELKVRDSAYMLDVCRNERGWPRVVECNPFSGSDLYGCDLHAIVEAIGGLTK